MKTQWRKIFLSYALLFMILVTLAISGCGYSKSPIIPKTNNISSTGGALGGDSAEERIVTFTVTGKGLVPETAINIGQGRLMAERAAINDGYRKLVEKIRGVYINAFSQTTNGIVDYDVIRTQTQSWLRGVEIISIKESGYGIFNADMQLRLYFTQNDMIWWPTGLGNNVIPAPSKEIKQYLARPSFLSRSLMSASAAVKNAIGVFVPGYGQCDSYPWCGEYYYY